MDSMLVRDLLQNLGTCNMLTFDISILLLREPEIA